MTPEYCAWKHVDAESVLVSWLVLRIPGEQFIPGAANGHEELGIFGISLDFPSQFGHVNIHRASLEVIGSVNVIELFQTKEVAQELVI